jgi:cell division protein FtsN
VTPEPDTQITPPAPVAPAETQSATKPKPAAKKKPPAKKTAAKQTNFDELGSEPVVLVPPSKQAAQSQSSSAASQPVTTAPATPPEQPTTQAANPQKRKTIFDLFNGGTGSGDATTAAPTQTKQAATPAPQQKAAPAPAQPQASTGGGYVVQLASFRSDTDAKTEYSRLAKDYPSIVGPLKSQIRQTSVGGSTRYQLGLGPLPTRGDATRVCGELIAAGESDCIVRGP